MSIEIEGYFYFNTTKCQGCGADFTPKKVNAKIACPNCGASYKETIRNIDDSNGTLKMTCEFDGYSCTFSKYGERCSGKCPAPGMFCMTHCDDVIIEDIQKDIIYNDKKIEEAKARLQQIEESKKTWMITELSGLSEE